MKSVNKIVIIFSIAALLLISPLVILQAFLFKTVFINTMDVKIFLGILLFLLLLFEQAYGRKTVTAIDYFMCSIFFLFIILNLFQIFYNSALEQISWREALGAFFYNYGLLLFVFPIYLIGDTYFVLKSSRKALNILIIYFIIIDCIALLQYFLHNYLLPSYVISILTNGDYIKFDNIQGHIRAMSLLKSPLELGIFNVFAATFFYSLFSMKKRWLYFAMFMLSSITVFTTLSRTAMAMYIISIFTLIILVFFNSSHARSISAWSKKLLFISFVLAAIFIFLLLYHIILKHALFDPTNLFIRLHNWQRLFGQYLNTSMAWLFGKGIVQNADYGAFYSIVIDNTYIGIMLTGGMVCLFIFFIILCYALIKIIFSVSNMDEKYRVVGFAFLAFFCGFLIGGITENLMHLFYYLCFALIFMKIVPKKISYAK